MNNSSDNFKTLYKKATKYFVKNQAISKSYATFTYKKDLTRLKLSLKDSFFNNLDSKTKKTSSKFDLQAFLQNKYVLITVVIIIVLSGFGYYTFVYKKESNEPEVTTTTYDATVEYVRGNVQIKSLDGEWKALLKNDVGINVKTSLKTSVNTKATIKLSNGDIIRVNEDTEITITGMSIITLIKGDIYIRKVENESTITIVTDAYEYQSLGTAFHILHTDKLKGVEVYHNKVKTSVVADNTSKIVAEGKKYFFENVAHRDQEIKLLGIELADIQSDSFIMWNREQDVLTGDFADKMGILEDIQAPELNITDPSDGTTTEEDTILIKGETDKTATIYINNIKIDNRGGDFEYKYSLNEGDNKITIEVVDESGNKAIQTIIVTKKIPPTITPTPLSATETPEPTEEVEVTPTTEIEPTDTPVPPTNTPVPPTNSPTP